MADLTLLTWNILAQAYVRPDRYPHSTPDALAPGPRRERVLDHLAAHAADVLCLQEVDPDVFEAALEALPDHEGFYVARRERPDGSAVLHRRSLEVLDREALHYAAADPGRDDVAAIVTLAVGDRRLGVVSTHLRWQPRTTPREAHVGRRQLLEVLDRAQGSSVSAWLVAGDFNALSESVVLQAALERGYRLSCRSQRPWDTVNIGGRRRKLDYVLYTPDALEPHPGRLPTLERSTPMPSAEHPSDHLPLEVGYTWR